MPRKTIRNTRESALALSERAASGNYITAGLEKATAGIAESVPGLVYDGR